MSLFLTWSHKSINATNFYLLEKSYLVVNDDGVVGRYFDLEQAKSVLKETKSGNRFIAPVNEYNEVMKEAKDPLDPHYIDGELQTTENGFNKFWCDYHCIIRLIEMCKEYLRAIKGK